MGTTHRGCDIRCVIERLQWDIHCLIKRPQ